jgi:gliding motility-associated-like protein
MTVDKSVSADGNYNISCAGTSSGFIDASAINYVGSVSYLWSDGNTNSYRVNMAAGEYKVIITDSNNCTADSTITLTAPDTLKITADVIKPFCPDNPNGEISLNVTGGIVGNDYAYKWSDNSTTRNLSNISVGLYIVKVTDLNGCSAVDSLQVTPENETCLVISNAISPNGDLINDVWNIGHIEEYPLAEVKIFNNWGVVVWKSEQGYPHPWDGRSNGMLLPVDSYFYIIDLHNGTKPISGSVTIIK